MSLSGDIEIREEAEVGFRDFDLVDNESESGEGDRNQSTIEEQGGGEVSGSRCTSSIPYVLEKFTLFQTSLNFYMTGRDAKKQHWRVLKIDRSESSELVIHEDPITYSFNACYRLLQEIDEANNLSGGLQFVANCYGIVGFIRFLGPYYMIVITERKRIGQVCGHPIYAVARYKMFPIPNTFWSGIYDSRKEKRYRKLLQLVDMRKDFFFSYSYPIMHSLQKNLYGSAPMFCDGTMFVWNKFLTRQIQTCPDHNLWTVALVHGFFKQVNLSKSGKTFTLTLVARRSSHFAGTRYLKRGVDEKGRAANDVEIEQIVCQEIEGKCMYKITSVVQNRGSIPLCWSQKSPLINFRPDIIQATRLHFENLRQRYGDHIIIMNLIKKCEKKQRESLLSKAFHGAVASVCDDWPEKGQLEFMNIDLDAVYREESTDVLESLKSLVAIALQKVGIFSCEIHQYLKFKAAFDICFRSTSNCNYSENTNSDKSNNDNKLQNGILRTNCLDSLDRTNVAQYVYSYVALGHQLYPLGISGSQELDFNHALKFELMAICEAMGHAISQQYGGSASHSKIFSKARGTCKVASECSEILKTMQRHYSNSFIDADKQKAIDLFLGHLQPAAELAPPKSNLDKTCNIEGVSAIFLKNKSRIIPYISSGQLLIDLEGQWFGRGVSCFKEAAESDRFDPPCQTG